METLHKIAIAKMLNDGTKAIDIPGSSYTHWGLELYEIGGQEWAVGTDGEADEACKNYIKETLWAFNSSFIIKHSSLPYEAEEMISNFQQTKFENANETILALIEDIDEFCEDAISLDGRGHFLNGYDGNEEEITFNYKGEEYTFFLYRWN